MVTVAELKDMKQFRAELDSILPPELNTDFNIRRWITGSRVQAAVRRFRVYIENRRLAGLDDASLLDNVASKPIIARFGQFFSFNLVPIGVNSLDNNVVFLQRLESVNYHALTKVLSCGQFLMLHFALFEWNLRQVLRCEHESGRMSGLTMILDLKDLPVLRYANPFAAIHKIVSLCFGLLEDNYPQMLSRLIIVHPPRGVGIITKFLRADVKKMVFMASGNEELCKFVDPMVLPVRYGGSQRLASETMVLGGITWRMDRESVTLVPRAITNADYVTPRAFKTVKVCQKRWTHLQHVPTVGSKLIWHFKTNVEVQFSAVVYITGPMKGPVIRLIPLFTVVTPELPETGEVTCTVAGYYGLEVINKDKDKHDGRIEYTIEIESPTLTTPPNIVRDRDGA